MWICNQTASAKKEPLWLGTVISAEPLTVMGKGVHKDIHLTQGLTLNIGDRVILARCSGRIYIIAKI